MWKTSLIEFVSSWTWRTRGMLVGVALFGIVVSIYANDTAVEVAAGGIQPRKDARISIEKERLSISLKKVTVEYEFLNSTDQDIITEVGFPMPPYEYYEGIRQEGAWEFADFRVWAEGRELHYQTESRAKVKDADYTDLLNRLGIDVQTFDHHDPLTDSNGRSDAIDASKQRIEKLPEATRENLLRLGLIEPDTGNPTWTVFRTFYWTQKFPAHHITKVRHEYAPVIGFSPHAEGDLKPLVKNGCIEPGLQKELTALWVLGEGGTEDWYINATWVKYLLTTANNWKTPIKDFELILDLPETAGHGSYYVSLCWDGKVIRSDKTHFVAKESNFVPKNDLEVYYLRVGPQGIW